MSQAIDFTAGNIKSAMKNAGATSGDLWRVPRASLRVKPDFNVRNVHDPEYQEHIRWIAASIRENGFFSDRPLAGFVARDGDEDVIYVTDGHTRLAAVDMLIAEGVEITHLPVVTKARGTSIEDLTVALYTSNGGRPLTPIETAEVCKRLTGFGWDERQIAQRLGLTPTYVGNLLDLAAAHPEIRQMVQSGKVAATLAMEVLRKDGANARETLRTAVQEAEAEGKAKITRKRLQSKMKAEGPAAKASGMSNRVASTLAQTDSALPAASEAGDTQTHIGQQAESSMPPSAPARRGPEVAESDLKLLLHETLAFLLTLPETDETKRLITQLETHLIGP